MDTRILDPTCWNGEALRNGTDIPLKCHMEHCEPKRMAHTICHGNARVWAPFPLV